jgi:predicted dehydrogenase
MTETTKLVSGGKPRLRFFENAPGQQHIPEQDKYLYAIEAPKTKLAIIGTGTIGQEHMRVAKLLGRAAIHGVYDQSALSVDVALANFAALDTGSALSKASAPKVYQSLDEACQDPAIDALMVCTPNFTHFDIIKAAMASGKPIFLEKPIATTLADAAAIVELARGYSSFIQLGLQYRYKAQYVEALHEINARGSLGVTQTISMSEYRPPFLDKVGQWNKFNALSGGTLVEKCCHYFDLINLIAEARPTRVYASAGRSGVFDGVIRDQVVSDIDDNAFVVIDYANGVRANFALNMNAPDFTEELCVVGDRGRLTTCERFQQHHGQQAGATVNVQLGEQGASRETTLAYASAIEASGHHGATYYEHAAFLDRIEARAAGAVETSAAATPEQGLWSMLVASAAQESSRTGEAVSVDATLIANGLDSLLK